MLLLPPKQRQLQKNSLCGFATICLMDIRKIRNFCIIAHIDHGKSTLCDRLLEATGTIKLREMKEQVLDTNPISRERGITIKLAPVTMNYKDYQLNLIDTPGHVDFAYEVSRSLAACEGAILLVDAVSGIQAQTMSVFRQAKDLGLRLVPVVNKIDLAAAQPENVALDMIKLFGFPQEEIIFISAKTGQSIPEVLDKIITSIPFPKGVSSKPLQALVFDSHYDSYLGAVADVRIMNGEVGKQELFLLATQVRFSPVEIGFFSPKMVAKKSLFCGEVGYIATGLKSVGKVEVGDTISQRPEVSPLPGYKEPKPVVFLGLYPVDSNDYLALREALEKLNLNDAAFSFTEEFSQALGKGFRCGFAGLLHAEVVQERLEREFNLNLIASVPNVAYEYFWQGEHYRINTAIQLPDGVDNVFEPWARLEIFTPSGYMGKIMELLDNRRGKQINIEYLSGSLRMRYEVPLAELITDFFDRLKSVSSGFASLDYEVIGYRQFKAVRLDILIHKERIDAFSQIVPKEKAHFLAKKMVERLKKVIPRQLFEVAIQAAVDSRVIARETIRPFRKDVIEKLYGGDQTRKDKLLKKQKKGKKRMKQFGRIIIPQEAFLAVLKRS